ncbi:MAG: enolase C-terminal domain-like protein [Opitutaceae bacterium]
MRPCGPDSRRRAIGRDQALRPAGSHGQGGEGVCREHRAHTPHQQRGNRGNLLHRYELRDRGKLHDRQPGSRHGLAGLRQGRLSGQECHRPAAGTRRGHRPSQPNVPHHVPGRVRLSQRHGIGRPQRDQLPCRADRRLPLGHPGQGGQPAALEDFAPQALEAKANNFRAYKIHPGRGQHREATKEPIPSYVGHIEEIRSVRKAVGEEFTLLFDPVQQYNVHEALAVGHVLEEEGYVSFEDPIPSTDIEGLIELRQKLTVPIEVGEFLNAIQAFAEYIRRGALDIVRLISDNVGGITGSFRVGQLADAFGMPCTPHNWGNGFDLAVHMQLELALPNCYWFEMPYPPTLPDRSYMKHQFRLDKDGYVNAPPGPGLGVELDHDALDKILLRIDR